MTNWMRLLPSLALVAPMLLGACTVYEGNGNIVEETRALPRSPDTLRVDDLKVKIEIDPALEGPPQIVLTGDENLLSHVSTQLEGRRLVIEEDAWLDPTVPLTARLRVRDLAQITADGGELHAVVRRGRRLRVKAGGDAFVYLSGDVRTLELNADSSASVDARDLSAWVGHVNLRDRARAEVCTEDTLTTEQTGYSELHSYCRPYDVVEDLQDEARVYYHR